MADDALTDAERHEIAWTFHGAGWLSPERAELIERVIAARVARARAEGARDALNAAADIVGDLSLAGSTTYAAWLRERAAQHEEQP